MGADVTAIDGIGVARRVDGHSLRNAAAQLTGVARCGGMSPLPFFQEVITPHCAGCIGGIAPGHQALLVIERLFRRRSSSSRLMLPLQGVGDCDRPPSPLDIVVECRELTLPG